jgi:EmrB/QacA subfamily drug resistance transporter
MSHGAEVPSGPLNPYRWWSLVGLCGFTFLVWLTATDINIALPTIGREFKDPMDSLQWAVSGYFLAGSLIIVGGRLGDLKGRRLIFMAGGALLLVGSVVAALAGGVEQLVGGRVIQGVAAAAILPTSLAMVAVGFPPEERPKAVAIWIAVAWGGQGVGPLIGGGLVDAFGWPGIFWVNIPLGLAFLALVFKTTPESSDDDGGKLDVPGAFLIMGGLLLVSFGLVQFDTASSGELVLLFGGAIVLFILFALVERKVADPLVPLSVFSKPKFMGAVSANFLANVAFAVVVFLMALYLQIVLVEDPLTAGALLLPATATILLFNLIGEWMTRTGRFRLAIALGMLFLGIGCLVLTGLDGTYGSLLPGFILVGIGIGLQITPATELAVTTSGAGEGVASGVFKATSMIGGSIGVALATAVFQSRASSKLAAEIDASPDTFAGRTETSLLDVITGSQTPVGLPDLVKKATDGAFEVAAGDAMFVGVLAAVIGLVLALALLGRTDRPGESDDEASAVRG